MQQYQQQPQYQELVFKIPSRYEVVDVLGEGAYGVVGLAWDTLKGRHVAIKKVEPFERSLLCIRTLREIKILRHFKHENIIPLFEVLKETNPQSFEEIYLVQEYMNYDLHKVIRQQVLTDRHHKYFMYQLLRGLKALHSADVIHRDLKPSNLLINIDCQLKICDFGLLRIDKQEDYLQHSHEKMSILTEYVATRWYRAPEIMLTVSQYSKLIDVWSCGCILAEMFLKRALFPGRDYKDQLVRILELLGTPIGADLKVIKSRGGRDYIKSLPFYRKRNLKQIFLGQNPLGIDLLEKMLAFNPVNRITVEDLLLHPYLKDFANVDDEPIAKPIPEDFFAFDYLKDELSTYQLRELIYRELSNNKSHR